MKLIYFEEIPSTNTKLKEMVQGESLEEYSVVEAGFQTAGRGQKGNFWEAKAKENLTFSVLLKPTFVPIEKQFILSQIVSLALKHTLDIYLDNITIKWPNDIYYKDSKICGILIENLLDGRIIKDTIVGIGLNINQEKFESNAPNPISVLQVIGKEVDINIVRNTFLQNLSMLYETIRLKSSWIKIQDQYFDSLYRRNGVFEFEDIEGSFLASIHHVDDEGFLFLKIEESCLLKKYAFKEVKYIL